MAGECFLCLLACFFRGGLIDGFQITCDGLVVIPGDEPQSVAHYVYDTQLHAGFRIYSVDGDREAFQPVNTGEVDTVQTAIFQFSQHIIQNFAPSFSASHMPSSSFCPSILIPKARNTDLFMT